MNLLNVDKLGILPITLDSGKVVSIAIEKSVVFVAQEHGVTAFRIKPDTDKTRKN